MSEETGPARRERRPRHGAGGDGRGAGTSPERCPSPRAAAQPPGTVGSSTSHEPRFFLLTWQGGIFHRHLFIHGHTPPARIAHPARAERGRGQPGMAPAASDRLQEEAPGRCRLKRALRVILPTRLAPPSPARTATAGGCSLCSRSRRLATSPSGTCLARASSILRECPERRGAVTRGGLGLASPWDAAQGSLVCLAQNQEGRAQGETMQLTSG